MGLKMKKNCVQLPVKYKQQIVTILLFQTVSVFSGQYQLETRVSSESSCETIPGLEVTGEATNIPGD